MRQIAGFREERPAKRQKLQLYITNMFGRIGPKFVEVVDSHVQKYFNHPQTPSSPGQAVKRCYSDSHSSNHKLSNQSVEFVNFHMVY